MLGFALSNAGPWVPCVSEDGLFRISHSSGSISGTTVLGCPFRRSASYQAPGEQEELSGVGGAGSAALHGCVGAYEGSRWVAPGVWELGVGGSEP
jgi:hypothetical protein